MSDNSRPLPASLAGGRYEFLVELGRGGMATVYRARDTRLEHDYAIKILAPEFAIFKPVQQRFLQEARVMARLRHPNILPIVTADTEGDTHYIVMDLVEGQNAKEYAYFSGGLAAPEAARLMHGILAGLAWAHKKGVIHRDVKPENILLTNDGGILLSDFGIAFREDDDAERGLTKTGVTIGTRDYMAPEQEADAKRVDHRVDIYAAGCTLFYLFMRKTHPHLFHTGSDPGILQDIPRPFAEVIKKATSYKPDERYQSAEEMSQAIAQALAEFNALPAFRAEPLPRTVVPSIAGTSSQVVKKRSLPWAVLAAPVAIVVWLLWPEGTKDDEPMAVPEVVDDGVSHDTNGDARVLDTGVKEIDETILTPADLAPAPAVPTPVAATAAIEPPVPVNVETARRDVSRKPKPPQIEQSFAGSIKSGTLTFRAKYAQATEGARFTLRYKEHGSTWKHAAMKRQADGGYYEVSITVDETMQDDLKYVVEEKEDGQDPVLSAPKDNPHIVKP